MTALYPLGLPATETKKMQSWKVALNFFIGNKDRMVPKEIYIPPELTQYSVD